MPFVPAANTFEVRIVASQNGIPIVNVFHVRSDAGMSAPQREAIAGAVKEWAEEWMLPMQHSSYGIERIIVTDVSVPNGAFTENVYNPRLPGTNAGAAAGANVAMVASLRTGVRGRSYRGRIYLGGLTNSHLADAQHFLASSTLDWAIAVDELMQALQSLSAALVVVSKVANGVARVAAVVTEVLEILVNTKVDSQRRRTAN